MFAFNLDVSCKYYINNVNGTIGNALIVYVLGGKTKIHQVF